MVKILIVLAAGCEELEAVTIINICRRAGFTVVSVGLEAEVKPVVCRWRTVIVPDSTLDAEMSNEFDMIVLPGGQPGTDNLRQDARVKALLQNMHSAGKYVAAICAAPMVLAEAGVLSGKTATCFPGCLRGLGLDNIDINDEAVVRDGNVITSRGPGTAMDFALEIVDVLGGTALEKKVAHGLCRK